MSSLAVALGPVSLPNPILVASGTFGYGSEAPSLTRAQELGGIVTKTVTVEPRAGNPGPRIHETPSGLLNSIGLQNVGARRFVSEKLPKLRALGVPIIVSIGGRQADDFVEVAKILEDAPDLAALEINISCPNVKEGGLEFCAVPTAAAAVVSRVRAATRRPLWAKLSPNVTSIGTVARACEEAGADGLTAINTFVGMAVDLATRTPVIPGVTGGLSGPAIRPLALAKVREVVRSTKLPVIGSGGIASASDALEFLLVGARAVQIGTANFREPWLAADLVLEIRRYLEESARCTLDEWINSLRVT